MKLNLKISNCRVIGDVYRDLGDDWVVWLAYDRLGGAVTQDTVQTIFMYIFYLRFRFYMAYG